MKKEQTSAISKLFLKLDTSGKILNLMWIFSDLKAGKRYFLLDVKLQMSFSLRRIFLFHKLSSAQNKQIMKATR